MSAIKMFSVAGCSTQAGEVKLRFANDSGRAKVLAKNGHIDIDLLDLPREMSKIEIAEYFIEINFANGRVVVDELVAELLKKSVAPAVVAAPVVDPVVAAPVVDPVVAAPVVDPVVVLEAVDPVVVLEAVDPVVVLEAVEFDVDSFEVALM